MLLNRYGGMLMSKKYMILVAVVLVLGVFLAACSNPIAGNSDTAGQSDTVVKTNYSDSRYEEIYLAGGCFWGVEEYFDNILGVVYTNVGYANGESDKTDYSSISKTGHTETIYLVYDPEVISLERILEYFYSVIEPTSLNRQGNDRGTQYRSGIYYVDDKDIETINAVTKKEQEKYSDEIVTEIEPIKNYVLAEDYHQDYLKKNPNGYCHIDLTNIPQQKPFIKVRDYPVPSLDEIEAKLSKEQFSITQENATEPAFNNPLWDNKEEGLYVDIVTGEPLFLSTDKFDSGSGWPSFTRPIQNEVVVLKDDASSGMQRIEARSRIGNSHLGHVFSDGPKEEGGQRYCINSGALEFIAVQDFEAKGYGDFKVYFE
jgi:peptide methionine sulfoxide reductase msrA/msrB